MKLLETFIPESLIEVLGWTLLHSLWQGLLLGIVLLILFNLNKDISPRFKYGISTLSLFALPLAAVITFSMIYRAGEANMAALPGLVQSMVLPVEPAINVMVGKSMAMPLTQRLSGAFDWLILFWLLGVLLFSVRLSGGLFLTARMRRNGIRLPDNDWLARFKQLQARAGIARGISYLVSLKIQVPSVIGILKPVVLLPASMLSGMPAEQIEAVIVHELAHIKRYDFLVNILQTLVEAIFFYHPVVWFISLQVRKEREKCCDDFAVALCGKISIYAKALAGISEMQYSSPVPAVALSNNKKEIFHRVERLLKSKKMKNNANPKWVAGLIIMASALLITVSTGAALNRVSSLTGPATEMQEPDVPAHLIDVTTLLHTEPAEPVVAAEPDVPVVAEVELMAAVEFPLPPETAPIPSPIADSSMEYDVMDNMVTHTFRDKDGNKKNMKFLIKNGEVKELYVDGERVPQDKMSDYDKEIDKVLDDLSVMERELINARTELEELDPEKMKEEIHQNMEHFREFEMQALHEDIARMHEDIHVEINMDSIKAEIQEAHKRMEEIHWDEEKMEKIIDQSLQSIQEAIEKSIQEAMIKLENIDFTKMEKNIRKSLENLEIENFHIQNRMKTLDEMILELEKLELKE